MKYLFTVDVAKVFPEGFNFTTHFQKKTFTFKVKALGEGFRKIEAIVKEENNLKR